MTTIPQPTPLDTAAAVATTLPPPRELDLFAFLMLLLRHVYFILACGLIAMLGMAVVMLRTKPRFASTAVMIVPQGNVTSSTLQAQLSLSTIDLLGGGYELYGDIIRSRVVADRLIAEFDLKDDYHNTDQASLEGMLASLTTVETQREGLISVTVQDENAQRAADLANAYLHQLDLLNHDLVLNSIGRERKYLGDEMVKEKDALADAEVALAEVQKSTSGLDPNTQASGVFSALEGARAQLRGDQIRLAALLTGETDENPEVIRLKQEIATLAGQVEAMQRGTPSEISGTTSSQVPEQTLLFTRRQREVKFHEALFDILEKQYESAKQQEAQNPSIVQMLDPAVPSVHKAWPPRTYYCVAAAITGTLLGAVLVAFQAVVMAYIRNPKNAEKLRQLKTFYRRQPRAL